MAPIQHDVNTLKNGFNKTFTPKLGKQIENGAKVVGHYVIPAATAALGGIAGDFLGGPLDGVAGSAAGAYAGDQINHKIGIKHNTNFDGTGMKRRRNVKGGKLT